MNWRNLPLWFKTGSLTAAIIVVLEALYATTILLKTSAAFIVFPFHVILLFPVMLLIGFFKSPEFLVEELIPPASGLFFIILFWFILGTLVGIVIEALKPQYNASENTSRK